MKKIIVAVAMVMGLTVNAQTKEDKIANKPSMALERKSTALTPEERADIRINRLNADLTLNEKQQAEIKKVLVAIENDRQKLVEENRANRKAGAKLTETERDARKIKALEQKMALDNELKKILTPEQFTKYGQLKDEKRTELKKGKALKVQPAQK